MIPQPTVTARTWGPAPAPWIEDQGWIGEWMTIGDETWYARIHPHGEPGRPPIVMLHGLVVSGAYYRPIADLMDRRSPIYVPDLPGYGLSRSPRLWTMPSLVTQLGVWMDAHEIRDAVIVGNSLGSQMATLLAVTRPELVRSLILIGPTLDPQVTNPIQLIWRGALDIPRERQSLWTIWIPDFLRAGPRRALFMLQQTFEDDQLSRLGDIRQPALMIGGEHDPVVPQRWLRQMASRMPNAEAVIVPGASHALNYSNAPELAAAIARAIDLPVERRLSWPV